jgi:hypothetical protein
MDIANINLRLQDGCCQPVPLPGDRLGAAPHHSGNDIFGNDLKEARLLDVTIGGTRSSRYFHNSPTGEFDVSGY